MPCQCEVCLSLNVCECICVSCMNNARCMHPFAGAASTLIMSDCTRTTVHLASLHLLLQRSMLWWWRQQQ
jgi:hypothetical protein